MPTPPVADLTNLLHAWREGNGNAFGQLIDQVYGELKVISAKRLNQSGGTATVTPTELLHEALIGIMPSSMNFESRGHFFATVSLGIRSILVDRARAHSAQKRGGDRVRITLSGLEVGEESQIADLLVLEAALTQLESLDPRCGQVMHLTFFAGLTREEIATLLKISVTTVRRDLSFGRTWLAEALGSET